MGVFQAYLNGVPQSPVTAAACAAIASGTNLADAAIVAGVAGLLYGFVRSDSAAKAP